jgi:hypothetical protein
MRIPDAWVPGNWEFTVMTGIVSNMAKFHLVESYNTGSLNTVLEKTIC